jgi:hypothetical protein
MIIVSSCVFRGNQIGRFISSNLLKRENTKDRALSVAFSVLSCGDIDVLQDWTNTLRGQIHYGATHFNLLAQQQGGRNGCGNFDWRILGYLKAIKGVGLFDFFN